MFLRYRLHKNGMDEQPQDIIPLATAVPSVQGDIEMHCPALVKNLYKLKLKYTARIAGS